MSHIRWVITRCPLYDVILINLSNDSWTNQPWLTMTSYWLKTFISGKSAGNFSSYKSFQLLKIKYLLSGWWELSNKPSLDEIGKSHVFDDFTPKMAIYGAFLTENSKFRVLRELFSRFVSIFLRFSGSRKTMPLSVWLYLFLIKS